MDSLQGLLDLARDQPIDALYVETRASDVRHAIESAPFHLAFEGRTVVHREQVHSTLTISIHEDLLKNRAGFDARALCRDVFGAVDDGGNGELGFAEVAPVGETTHGMCYTSLAGLVCTHLTPSRETTLRRWIASRDPQVTMLREFGWATYLNEHQVGRLGGRAALDDELAEATGGRSARLGLLAPLPSGGVVVFTTPSPFAPAHARDGPSVDLGRWLRRRFEAGGLWKEP